MKPRAVSAAGRAVAFADGSTLDVDAVIWATGYRPDYSWIDLPDDGRLRHHRGVTEIPGLYFLGLTWQYTRGSALLGWVKEDANFIAAQVARRAGERIPARTEHHEPARGAAAPAQQGV
jgi:putative flavoprotein involved in K+ transport